MGFSLEPLVEALGALRLHYFVGLPPLGSLGTAIGFIILLMAPLAIWAASLGGRLFMLCFRVGSLSGVGFLQKLIERSLRSFVRVFGGLVRIRHAAII